jgi:phosphohistidine phosphatase
MKRIYILRHAKAGQPHKKLISDHGRILHPKGIKACEAIGHYLTAIKADFTQVLCSDAKRTTHTAELVLKHFGKTVPTEYRHDIYLASAEELIEVIRQTDDAHKSVLLVGHNPGLHLLAMRLTEHGNETLIHSMTENFPTGVLAVIELDSDTWWDAYKAEGTLKHFTFPRELDSE